MESPARSVIWVVEGILAGIILLLGIINFTNTPRPYPAWPTFGGFPVDPELVLPALLGVMVLLAAIQDGLTLGSIVTSLLGIGALALAGTSLFALYSDEAGGVFWGGFLTLILGSILAMTVLVQASIRTSIHQRVRHQIKRALDIRS